MAAIKYIKRTVSLDGNSISDQLPASFFNSESAAHTFIIAAMRGGESIALSGAVSATFLNANDAVVTITGSIVDGAAVVTLSNPCYELSGRFTLTIDVNGATVYECQSRIKRRSSGTAYDPSGEISVATLSAEVAAMRQATAEATSAAAKANSFADFFEPFTIDAYLFRENAYFNPSTGQFVSNSVLNTYKIPLTAGDFINIYSETDTPWEAVGAGFLANVKTATGYTYIPISNTTGNKYGVCTTRFRSELMIFGYAETEYVYVSIRNDHMNGLHFAKNVESVFYNSEGYIKTVNTVSRVDNSIALATTIYQAGDTTTRQLESAGGVIRVLRLNAGDKLIFDTLPSGYAVYGTFRADSGETLTNISASQYTASASGIAFLYGYDAVNATLYPANRVKIAYEDIVGLQESQIPLAGKTIAFLGDSITGRESWTPYITQRLGGTGVNCGIGGTCLSGSESTAMWQASRLNTVKAANPDVLTILGGANDLVQNPAIGTEANLADKNTGTFIGAYSYIINNLLTWKPSLKIIILATTWAHNNGADYSSTVTYGDFAAACKLVAEYYHLPFVDLYNQSGFNQYTLGDSPFNIYSADHIHPNDAGGRIIASMVAAKIREVMGV